MTPLESPTFATTSRVPSTTANKAVDPEKKNQIEFKPKSLNFWLFNFKNSQFSMVIFYHLMKNI